MEVGVERIHDGQACAWAEAVWATLHVIQTLGYEVAFMFAAAQWISSWHWQCQDVANNGNHCVSFCCFLLLLLLILLFLLLVKQWHRHNYKLAPPSLPFMFRETN